MGAKAAMFSSVDSPGELVKKTGSDIGYSPTRIVVCK